jgi:hypothetical protein
MLFVARKIPTWIFSLLVTLAVGVNRWALGHCELRTENYM